MLEILALSDCGAGTPLGVIIGLTKDVVNLLYVVTPILIIVMGSIDFAKAVIAQDDAAMKKAFPAFLKRIIAGVVVFGIFIAIRFVFNEVIGASSAWYNCWKRA